jgi:hypothetical protein
MIIEIVFINRLKIQSLIFKEILKNKFFSQSFDLFLDFFK